MKNIVLFTHNDLDGIGCEILSKIADKYSDVYNNKEIFSCNYDNINTTIENYLNNNYIGNNTTILITDISVSDEIANKLNTMNISKKLLDHHVSAESLNKYNWCSVKGYIDKNKAASGTALYFREIEEDLKNNLPKDCFDRLKEFVENVRLYDTWEWNKDNNIYPKNLNDLFFIKKRETFVTDMLDKISNNKELISIEDYKLIDMQQKEIEEYIEEKNKDLIKMDVNGFCVGVLFAEKYISELGNKISLKNQDCDFIAIIKGKSVSLRTTKENVDLSKIAKSYGGGGHKMASGFSLPDEKLVEIYNIVFTSV